ncbi:GNAT family N-acetyltransferase [Terrabacter terrae]|uniref:GNAT family N-acetyltransferase n=1 Tax=Terrabacter terrae TaxID=318434 RepID=UPI0031CED11C
MTAHRATPTTRAAGSGYEVTVPAPRPEWRKAFAADPLAQAFHSPEWVDGVCAAGGFTDVSRLYRAPDGRQLVLPLVRRRLGLVQASLPPSWGIGGVLSADDVRPEDLVAIWADLRRQRGVLRTSVRPSVRSVPTWAAADLPGAKVRTGTCHVLDLEGGFDTVWRTRFTGTARTAVRKAEKSGVVVERDTTGARLPEYFTLLESSVERWAAQQHEPLLLSRWRARQRDPLHKLQALAAAVPGSFSLYLAMWEGRAVAGDIVYSGTNARYTNGAMIKELAGPVRANFLVHRTAIEDACAAGSTHFDFGESGDSPGLAQYKSRFGAQPLPSRVLLMERLPITETDRALRGVVKRAIGFRDAG